MEIGANVVIAEDNTLGGDSPYEGRVYMAFVGYYNVTISGVKNPACNTDIFLTYSDDGGRTWSDPVEVNNDNNNGSSGDEDSVSYNRGHRRDHRPEPVPARDRRRPDDRDRRADLARLPRRHDQQQPGGDLHHRQHRRRQNVQRPGLRQPRCDRPSTPSRTRTIPWARSPTTRRGPGRQRDLRLRQLDGPGRLCRPGLPDLGRQLQRGLPQQQRATVGFGLSVYSRPMVIAAGPRVVSSQEGPVAFSEAAAGAISFTVTFDRPIDPQIGDANVTPGSPTWSFYEGDVQVYYEGTTFGEPFTELPVTSVVPVIASGVGPDDKFGYTEFTVTFSYRLRPEGQLYRHLQLPDHARRRGRQPRRRVDPLVRPRLHAGYGGARDLLLGHDQPADPRVPGGGGTGTGQAVTTSTIGVNGFNNQLITGVTVNLTLTATSAAGLVSP